MISFFFVCVCVCKEPKSDVNDMHADESNFDADSDNETKTTDLSTKPFVPTGSFVVFRMSSEEKRSF